MRKTMLRQLAALIGGAAAVAAVAVECGMTVNTAEPAAPGPITGASSTTETTSSATPPIDPTDSQGEHFGGPAELVQPSDGNDPGVTTEQLVPGDEDGPSTVISSGESATPPTVETQAPPTGGGRGGH